MPYSLLTSNHVFRLVMFIGRITYKLESLSKESEYLLQIRGG